MAKKNQSYSNKVKQSGVVEIDILSLVQEYSVNPFKREILLTESIEEGTYIRFESAISYLESLSETEPISVILSTGGGIVSEAQQISERIMSSKNKIIIIATSEVMSSGIFILAAGDERWTKRDCIYMHHHLSAELPFSRLNDQKINIKWLDSVENKINKFLEKQTGTSLDFWNKKGKKSDYFFDAEEALKIGLVHKIIENVKKI
jgi:ATP-dependent Clp protease protease subunit